MEVGGAVGTGGQQSHAAARIAELGHIVGRRHVDCGGPANPDPYPYPPCQLGNSSGEAASWGFDGLTQQVIHPTDAVAADVMSYGKPRWISDFTWNGMADGIPTTVSAPAPPGPGSFLFLRFYVGSDAVYVSPGYLLNATEMTDRQQVLVAEGIALQNTPTDYALELLDSDDAVLFAQPVEFSEVHAEGAEAPSRRRSTTAPLSRNHRSRTEQNGRATTGRWWLGAEVCWRWPKLGPRTSRRTQTATTPMK